MLPTKAEERGEEKRDEDEEDSDHIRPTTKIAVRSTLHTVTDSGGFAGEVCLVDSVDEQALRAQNTQTSPAADSHPLLRSLTGISSEQEILSHDSFVIPVSGSTKSGYYPVLHIQQPKQSGRYQ